MNELLIYGAGGLGREIASSISAFPDWKVMGFIDDNPILKTVEGFPVFGGIDKLKEMDTYVNLVVAVGDPILKEKIVNQIKIFSNINFPSLVHPSVIILNKSSVKIGKGSIVCAGSILTTNIAINEHVLINLNVTIGHDVVIGKFSSIMPGVNIAGSVLAEKAVLIGSGAGVLNGLKLGEYSRIGAGAVVTRGVSAGSTVIGIPARNINN